jgi:hypothetical protein
MFNGVSGLHEQGALVIPWVVVLLLTFGSTGGTATHCHVSYSDDWNALRLMTEQPTKHLVQITCSLLVLSLSNYLVLKGVSCKKVDGTDLSQDIVQWRALMRTIMPFFVS